MYACLCYWTVGEGIYSEYSQCNLLLVDKYITNCTNFFFQQADNGIDKFESTVVIIHNNNIFRSLVDKLH